MMELVEKRRAEGMLRQTTKAFKALKHLAKGGFFRVGSGRKPNG